MTTYTGVYIIPKPFDVLDAALEDAMPRPGSWIGLEVKREPVTSGSVVYRLLYLEWGQIGEIKLSKKSDTESELFIKGAPYPYAKLDMSKDNWQEVQSKTRDEIQKHLDDVLTHIVNRLNQNLSRGERIKRAARADRPEPATMRAQARDAMPAQSETSNVVNEQKAELASAIETTANVVAEEQARKNLHKESKVKRIFGLRTDFLIAGIILDIFISGASLVLYPDWARSNLTLVILFFIGFGVATTIIAGIRKAYE